MSPYREPAEQRCPGQRTWRLRVARGVILFADRIAPFFVCWVFLHVFVTAMVKDGSTRTLREAFVMALLAEAATALFIAGGICIILGAIRSVAWARRVVDEERRP